MATGVSGRVVGTRALLSIERYWLEALGEHGVVGGAETLGGRAGGVARRVAGAERQTLHRRLALVVQLQHVVDGAQVLRMEKRVVFIVTLAAFVQTIVQVRGGEHKQVTTECRKRDMKQDESFRGNGVVEGRSG